MPFRFAFRRYTLPFRVRVRTSGGAWTVREGLYVRVERPDGSAGLGEVSPLASPGSDPLAEAEAFCRSLGGEIDGRVLERIPRNLFCLRNALSCAFGHQPIQARHRSLNVASLIPAGRGAPAAVAAKLDAGFRTFKWKVGIGEASEELGILDDILAELPAGARVRLDANSAWNRKTAERWLDRCAGRPIEFVEQPVATEDGLRGLAQDYPVPIALDESIRGDGDVGRWLDLGWPGFYVVKPALLGDVDGVLTRLFQSNARVVFSSSLETGIGAQWALRAAFSWRGPAAALGFGVWPLFERAEFDGPAAAPFIRAEDVERLNPETLWNALS